MHRFAIVAFPQPEQENGKDERASPRVQKKPPKITTNTYRIAVWVGTKPTGDESPNVAAPHPQLQSVR
jgi:hypothetical protein